MTNKRIVFSAGTWDLFHIGHLNILRTSKKFGDYLIVAVSTDDLVKSYKKFYPAIPYKDRVEIVKACKYVDKAVKQTKLIDVDQLKRYKVNVITIGSDWKDRRLEGLEWAKKNGIDVIYIPYTKRINTSEIKKRIHF